MSRENGGAKVVCLCGSRRFREEFERVSRELTLRGCIVVMPHVWDADEDLEEGVRDRLMLLHNEKIAMSDCVVVVGKEGYVGTDTAKGVEYARRMGVRVEMWNT